MIRNVNIEATSEGVKRRSHIYYSCVFIEKGSKGRKVKMPTPTRRMRCAGCSQACDDFSTFQLRAAPDARLCAVCEQSLQHQPGTTGCTTGFGAAKFSSPPAGGEATEMKSTDDRNKTDKKTYNNNDDVDVSIQQRGVDPSDLKAISDVGRSLFTKDEGPALQVFSENYLHFHGILGNIAARYAPTLSLLILRLREPISEQSDPKFRSCALLTVAEDLPALAALALALPAYWMIGKSTAGFEILQKHEDIQSALTSHKKKKFFFNKNGSSSSTREGSQVQHPVVIQRHLAQFPALPSGPVGWWTSSTKAFNYSSSHPPVEYLDIKTLGVLLMGTILDGCAMNAYACTRYEAAWALHSAALTVLDCTATAAPNTNTLRLRCRALDGLGRVAREQGDGANSVKLHMAAIGAASAAAKSFTRKCTPDRSSPSTTTSSSFGSEFTVLPEPDVLLANAISNTGVAFYRQKQMTSALNYHTEGLRIRRAAGEARGIASSLGNIALLKDDSADAIPLYQESKIIREELGDTWGVAGSLRALAMAYIKVGNQAGAVAALQEAIATFTAVGDLLGISECLESLGLLVDAGEQRATLLGAAVAVRRTRGCDEAVVTDHPEAKRAMEDFPTQWRKGLACTVEEAFAVADEVKH